MLREKSNNKSLTSWLKNPSTQSSSQGHNNENTMSEEEQLKRALQQSRDDYRAQQRLEYELLSKPRPSISINNMPPIDDDDQWFQTISPRKIKRERKLSLNRTTPKRKRNDTNDTQARSPTAAKITTKKLTQRQQLPTDLALPTQQNSQRGSLGTIKEEVDSWEICDSQQKNNTQERSPTTISNTGTIQQKSTQRQSGGPATEPSLESVKEEEDSWEICEEPEATRQDDDGWDRKGSSSQVLFKTKEEESWEINEMDQSDDNVITTSNSNRPTTFLSTNTKSNINNTTTTNVRDEDDMEQYMAAIRNRTTKTAPPQTSTPTPTTSQAKRPASQLDDVFLLLSRRRPSMQKVRDTTTTTDASYDLSSVYQTSFDRHGTLTTNTVDNMELDYSTATRPSSTSASETTPTKQSNSTTSEQQLEDADPWNNDSDCSSIIDLCADGEMDSVTRPDHGSSNGANNNSSDLTGLFDDSDDADDELYNTDLTTTYDDTNRNDLDQWATTMDDNDLVFVGNNRTRPSPERLSAAPTSDAFWSTITASNDTHQAPEDDDDGYLSPLEGFTSLLDQSHTSADYRPYFDQLTASVHPPSRRPATTRSTGRGSGSRNRGARGYRGARRRGWYKKKK